jgi:hypothetical protein
MTNIITFKSKPQITKDDLVRAHHNLCLMSDTDDEGWERTRWVAINAIESVLGYNPGAA